MARDWSGFSLAIYVDAQPADVWKALSTPTGIVRWFTAKLDITDASGQPKDQGIEVAPGLAHRWEWHEGSSESGTVQDVEPRKRVRWTWYEDKGWAEFRLSEANGRALVEIEQRVRFDDQEEAEKCYIGCMTGWTFYLANLRSVLEGGLDLREMHPDRKDLVNY